MTDANKEMATSLSGPAVYSNRFVASGTQAGVKISFMEAGQDLAEPHFRAAVLLSYQDAVELRDLLTKVLAPVEKQLEELKQSKDRTS